MRTYYDTVPEPDRSKLPEYQQLALTQQEIILAHARANPLTTFAPHQLQFLFPNKTPITSIRRAITNLEQAGYLEKTGALIDGPLGRPVNTWRLFVPIPMPRKQKSLW